MHARHKSPGHGFRSNSTGLGAGTSGVSTDYSGRAHSHYNSDYRSVNSRGYGQGQAGRYKSFQQQPQSSQVPQKGDILMEAGRLAAEYLVSKGSLAPNLLPGKLQNGSFNKHVEHQEFRQDDHLSENRPSSHVRSSGFDSVSGRRRYSYNFSSRNQSRGRRRGDHYRGHASEWSREYGSSGQWSDRNRGSSDVELEDDIASDIRESNFHFSSVTDSSDKHALSTSELQPSETSNMDLGPGESHLSVDDRGLEESVSGDMKDKADPDHYEGAADSKNSYLDNVESKQKDRKELSKKSEDCDVENEIPGNGQDEGPTDMITDLAKLCRFAKVPTRMRSAIISRSSKEDQVMEDVKQCNVDPVKDHVKAHDDSITQNAPTEMVVERAPATFEISDDKTVKCVEGDKILQSDGLKDHFFRSQSFSNKAFTVDNEEAIDDTICFLGRSSSVKERGEKRSLAASDTNKSLKKAWLSSFAVENTIDNQATKQSEENELIPSIMGESLPSTVFFDNSGLGTCSKYSHEKQFFPFKICDLNLMETSSVSDIHCNDRPGIYPPGMNIKDEGVHVGIDLSITSTMANEFVTHTNSGKAIEVIDLEDDSTPEERRFGNPGAKAEAVFASPQGLAIHGSSAADIAAIQDNYDNLMMSELLNTFSSCASTNEDINPLQTGMGLHGGAGPLGDDDSIYMSLEEIPLSFIPAWQQSTPQEYEKPF